MNTKNTKFTTLEHQLFTWEDWDEIGVDDLSFQNITLVSKIGQFEPGTKLSTAFFLSSQSLLILMNEKNEEFIFKLNLSVGEMVDPASLKESAPVDAILEDRFDILI